MSEKSDNKSYNEHFQDLLYIRYKAPLTSRFRFDLYNQINSDNLSQYDDILGENIRWQIIEEFGYLIEDDLQ